MTRAQPYRVAATPTASEAAPATAATGARMLWLLYILVVAATFVHQYLQTEPVRFGNSDDVAFQAVVNANVDQAYLTEAAKEQGRFYFGTPVYRYLLFSPYRCGPVAFTLVRLGLLFSQAGLVGWLVARVLKDARLGAAVGLVIVATLHLTLTFYPVLSYPPMSIGFVAVLAAMHCHLSRIRGGSTWLALAAVALFLFSCTCLELFVVTLPVFVALSFTAPGRGTTAALRENAGLVVAAAAFIATYVYFAEVYPSEYGGTRLSLKVEPAVKILVRQMIGAMPGFELIVNRATSGPVALPLETILARLFATPRFDLGLAIAQAFTAAALLHRTNGRGSYRNAAIVMLAAAVLFNVPIAFSEKYQVFIFHREYPYTHGFYSFCFAIAGGLVFAAWLGRRSAAMRRWVFAVTTVALVATCISAKASNRVVLNELQRRFPPNAPASVVPLQPDAP